MTGSARPQGITILAVLSFIGGAFGLLGSLGAIGLGALVGSVGGLGFGGLFAILGIVLLVMSVAQLAIGYGFWTLKPWAWSASFILYGISLIVQVLTLLSGGGITNVVVSIAISLVVVYYLHQANVRQAFNAPTAGFPIIGTAIDKYIPAAK